MTHRIAHAALALFVVATAACGSDAASSTADQPEPVGSELPVVADSETLAGDTLVFTWAETGGCAQMGPNCARYEVAADGTVSTFREGSSDVAATGTVDVALVDAWLDAVDELDVAALQDRVGVGEMTAAFDGVDITAAAPSAGLELSSVETRFASDEAVFAAGQALAAAAYGAAPLEIESR